jgi:hypothetical protein
MCVRVSCKSCGKATYSGCGAHVEQVLRGVPAAERCQCDSKKSDGGGKKSWWPF